MHLFSRRRPARPPAPPASPPWLEALERPPRPADDDEVQCGWFASSAELRGGLSVTEHALAPAEFAALWPRPPGAA